MIFLISLIHIVFVGIFLFFHRSIEIGVLVAIYLVFVSKVFPPFDIIKKPRFLLSQTSESDSMMQSLYFSSAVLFYCALIGISLGISDYLNITADLRLFHYCVFFLTSIIYSIYFLSYPKNPTIFHIFRTHTTLMGIFLSGMVLYDVFIQFSSIPIFLGINLLLLVCGLVMVIILDNTITLTSHTITVYVTLFSLLSYCIVLVSFFDPSLKLYFISTLFFSVVLYVLFPFLIVRGEIPAHIPHLLWHFRNSILGITWWIFCFLFWSLFWGTGLHTGILFISLLFMFVFWSGVYIADDHNPIFFSGLFIILVSFCAYCLFYILPPGFMTIVTTLFLFCAIFLFFARFFREKIEERILGWGVVLFLCVCDFILIYQNYSLFSLSLLFFFQSFFWYWVYEIFHRYSHEKNQLL